jgi:hypothetical protein
VPLQGILEENAAKPVELFAFLNNGVCAYMVPEHLTICLARLLIQLRTTLLGW